jgi:expansin (peptidoglycan-binding protein)
VRNARYPLASVVVLGTHVNVPLTLKTYNYWESTAAGAGPLTLRLTDINGQTFDDANIKIDPQTEVTGKSQFSTCR